MKKVKKGTYGYIKNEKVKRALIAFGLFLIPIIVYVSGYIYHGKRENILTVVAILGCLPACKALLSAIMIWMQKPVNAMIVCGDEIICFTPDAKADLSYLEKHISKIMADNGYRNVHVKVMKEFKHYLQRVEMIRDNQERYREGLTFKPDERYPELSRDEVIYHTLLAISL